jgi:hypothetical protein
LFLALRRNRLQHHAMPGGADSRSARPDWNEVIKVAHYYLSVDAMTKPMRVREESPPCGDRQ